MTARCPKNLLLIAESITDTADVTLSFGTIKQAKSVLLFI